MKKIKERIAKIIECLDADYEIEMSNLRSRRENLKSLNSDTIAKHIKLKETQGETFSEKDLIRHISALIQD